MDGVRGLQLGPDRELGGGARAGGQQLPLHLGGEREPGGAPGALVEVGVPFGDQDLVAQQVGHVGQLADQLRGGQGLGQPDGEDAEPLAAYGHGQVVVDGVVVPDLLFAGLLAAERPALGTVVQGERLTLALGPVQGFQDPQTVVGEMELHRERPVDAAELRAQGGQQGVRRGGPYGGLDVRSSVHGLSRNLRPATW